MLDNFKIDGVSVNRPFEQKEGIKITAELEDGTLSEVQPVLNINNFTFTNSGLAEIINFRSKNGPYKQVPLEFEFANRTIFNGYLTDFNYLLDRDEIEAKPVSLESVDGLTELLSAVESSLLRDDYEYTDLDFLIEKVDINSELLQLSLSSLFYLYVFYTQTKEVANFIARATEATVNAAPPGLSFGTIAALVLEGVAQAIFLATTIIQLVNYAKQAKELLIPKVRTTKVTSFDNLISTALARIGYKFKTDIDDLKNNYHWASGNVNNDEYHPRSKDRCGSALGTISLIIDKYNAKVRVVGDRFYLLSPQSNLFANQSKFVLPDFIRGNYRENLDDMKGTREILYSVDYQDKWTLNNFRGTEYKIRANIDDPTKSTIKGLEQIDYGIALCNRKDELNVLERAWVAFVDIVNQAIQLFGGGSQTLSLPNRLGVAKISSEDLSVAKIVYLKNGRIPENHRDLLSAKTDENKYHWTKSHVRNPLAKKRLYEAEIAFDDSSLSSVVNNGYIRDNTGVLGKFTKVSWDYEKDCAECEWWLTDVGRDTKLKETFYEPIK